MGIRARVAERWQRRGEGPGAREGDRWLLLVTLLLLGAGLAMVLSASSVLSLEVHGTAYYYFTRQAIFAGLGLAAMAVLYHVDYQRLHRWAPLAAGMAAALMLAALLPGVGVSIQGASRWVDLGPLGTVQPAELGKLAFALFLAQWVDRRQGRMDSFSDTFVPFGIMTAAALGVLLLQRDLGSATVMCAIFVSIYLTGGGRKRDVALLAGCLLAAFLLFTVLESYRSDRLRAFLNPFYDPLGVTYQPVQALIGLGSGGVFGRGLGHSVLKYMWLPEAHTDYIFAIIGEETGLVGTTLTLAGFIALTVRGYRAAMRAPDRFGVALAAGLTTWIGFQALINMATVTVTLPATGVPLPFISAGGTAVAITLAAMGVLLNVAAQGTSSPEGEDAPPDRRRGHWRSPLAGARRRPGVSR